MSGELIIADIFPSELAQMVWDYLPLRTRATSCKSLFEKHYSELIARIPRFEPYVLSLIQDESCSYIFRLILERRYAHWMQLGRWVTHGGKHAGVYDTYISYLVHRCRVASNHKCLRDIQQCHIRPFELMQETAVPRPRPKRSSKNHKRAW
jgi:hypothetical protein